jgi:hypothetical protein
LEQIGQLETLFTPAELQKSAQTEDKPPEEKEKEECDPVSDEFMFHFFERFSLRKYFHGFSIFF